MRLDKLLANMGLGSRKEVKQLIRKGHVTINDQPVRQSNHHVNVQTDRVMVGEDVIQYQKYIYLMLHKPAGYISATEDRHEQTVIDLLDPALQHFAPFPVGRLDKDTEGLLLLTNDGELTHQLTSPQNDIGKTYYARIDGRVTAADVEAFKGGVTLRDGSVTKPADLVILASGEQSEIELTITEGKYHQVKRMFASQGKKVMYLKRIRMEELVLDATLPKGAYRELTTAEVTYCQSLVDR